MGHRLSRIYTRTGDGGTTGLADGSRVSKHATRIEALGEVDELNSHIGAILLQPLEERVAAWLTDVQHGLFDVGGELAIPGHVTLTALYAEKIERELDELNASLPPLKEFILPGGGAGAVACHIARTVCRRAERRLVALASEGEPVNPHSLRYLNRLSDFLFVLARVLARADRGEVFWEPGRNRD
jgi:cob(I)alamin adenosyltransferase